MTKCSECGYENMDGLDYCDGCGAKLVAAHGPSGSETSSTAAESSSPPTEPEPALTSETSAEALDNTAPEAGASTSAVAVESAVEEPAASKAPTGEVSLKAGAEAIEVEAAAPVKIKLSIIRGGRRGQEFELEPGNNLVGRWDPDTGSFPEVDLDADDPEAKVSRKHALIRIDASKITIEDIGSLNGTYVNRQPRLQPGSPLDLKDGDEIIIGKTFLKLSVNPIS